MRQVIKAVLVIVFILGTIAESRAQKVADSVERAFKSLPDDTSKVKKLYKVGFQFKSTDPQSTIWLSDILNFSHGKADAYNLKGMALFNMGNFAEAKNQHEEALKIYRQLNDKLGAATAVSNIGNVYYKQGNFPAALENYTEAARVCEDQGDLIRASKTYNNIASLHRKQGNLELSLEYNLKALKIREKLNDKPGLASTYNNLGSVYVDMKKYDLALSYYKKAIPILDETNDKKNLGTAYNNVGIIYRELKKYNDALPYYKKALALFESVPDKSGIAIALIDIGTVLESQGKYDEAIENHTKALKIATEIGNADVVRSAHIGLSSAYDGAKQYKKAMKEMELQDKMKDSMNTADSRRKIAEMETKYKTENKQKEIALLNKEKQLQAANLKDKDAEINRAQYRQLALVGGIVVALLASYLFYYYYRSNQKEKFDAQLLNLQESRNKAIIDAGERERVRIAKDLHDGIGQQISAVKLNLSAMEGQMELSEAQRESFKNVISIVDDAVKEVRSVSHNMMPNALLHSGLASAIREFLNKIASTGVLKVDLNIVGLDERLADTTEAVLYRVLQECVSNIVKHAQATQISIQLLKRDDRLNLMIEDNGKGFDSSKLNSYSGIGLKNIISWGSLF